MDLGIFSSFFGLLIPLTAIVMGIGIVWLALWIDYQKKRQLFEQLHKERMAAIEKGMEIPALPPELFQSTRLRLPSDYLRRGIIFLFIGIAVTAQKLFQTGQPRLWGLIFCALGIAYLLFYWLEGRKQKLDQQ